MTKNYRCARCKEEFLYCTEKGSNIGLFEHVKEKHPEGKEHVRLYVECRVAGGWQSSYRTEYLEAMGIIDKTGDSDEDN
jgi:hypothetical protein